MQRRPGRFGGGGGVGYGRTARVVLRIEDGTVRSIHLALIYYGTETVARAAELELGTGGGPLLGPGRARDLYVVLTRSLSILSALARCKSTSSQIVSRGLYCGCEEPQHVSVPLSRATVGQ